jgi:hypothetical protein
MGTDQEPDDRYFDLEGLARYSGLGLRTLRRLMDDPVNPLPTHHVHGAGSDRGRVLISKRAFDTWVTSFPPRRGRRMAKAEVPGAWVRKLVKQG